MLLLLVTIGYAALSGRLSINGNTSVKGNSWNIHFDNIQYGKNNVATETPAKIKTDDNTAVTFGVTFTKPGDEYEFTVDVVNSGSIDGMIKEVEITPDLDELDLAAFDYSVAYVDGSSVKVKDLLAADDSKTIKVRIVYKKDITNEQLIKNDVDIDVTVRIDYEQAAESDYSVVDESVPDEGGVIVVTGTGNDVGDEIAIGDEHFYIISNVDGNISALAKYNLNAGNMCNDTNLCTPIANPTYKQDVAMTGVIRIDDSMSLGHGSMMFSNTNGWPYSNNNTIDIQTYDGPVKTAINAYKEILPAGIDVRLITKSELEGLGCSLSGYSCSSAPSWVYSTSYWSGVADSTTSVVFVFSTNYISGNYYAVENSFGVRPVITFSENLIS